MIKYRCMTWRYLGRGKKTIRLSMKRDNYLMPHSVVLYMRAMEIKRQISNMCGSLFKATHRQKWANVLERERGRVKKEHSDIPITIKMCSSDWNRGKKNSNKNNINHTHCTSHTCSPQPMYANGSEKFSSPTEGSEWNQKYLILYVEWKRNVSATTDFNRSYRWATNETTAIFTQHSPSAPC